MFSSIYQVLDHNLPASTNKAPVTNQWGFLIMIKSTRDVGFVFSALQVEFLRSSGQQRVRLLPLSIVPGIQSQKQIQNPGVAPPDGALLFCWPKRVSRKGPALRWACLARQGGNLNSGQTIRRGVYISPAGDEALESLFFCGGLHRLLRSCSYAFPS